MTGSSRPTAAALAAGVFAALALAGCDGSSPTSPGAPAGPPPSSGMTIVFESAFGGPQGREDRIRAILESAYAAISREIPVDGVAVSVSANPQLVVAGWGVGGRAADGSRVELAIDAGLADDVLAERLTLLAAHELHHAARFRGPGYGRTLLEALVSEGLADRFADELFGPPRPPWTHALAPSQLAEWQERARASFDDAGYGHSAWFFGTSPSIPRWTGYAVGWALVEAYQDANGGPSAASLVHTPASAFRPPA